jgi:hypothetical protein
LGLSVLSPQSHPDLWKLQLIANRFVLVGQLHRSAQIAAIAFFASPCVAWAADAPVVMAPSSQWVVDYADDSCSLRRSFQSGADQVTLELRQFGPGDILEITLASTTLPRSSGRLQLRFEPDEGFYRPWGAFPYDDGESRGVLFHDSLRPNAVKRLAPPLPDWADADREARERAITALAIRSAFTRTLTLQTGSLHPPMNAMRTCLDELVTHWGLDATTQRTLSRRPKPLDLMDWSRRIQSSYPTGMVQRGRSGLVNIRLVVGPDGKPSACIPNKEFSTAGFEDHACAVTMRYARFEPALDASGAPVASFYATTITYELR